MHTSTKVIMIVAEAFVLNLSYFGTAGSYKRLIAYSYVVYQANCIVTSV